MNNIHIQSNKININSIKKTENNDNLPKLSLLLETIALKIQTALLEIKSSISNEANIDTSKATYQFIIEIMKNNDNSSTTLFKTLLSLFSNKDVMWLNRLQRQELMQKIDIDLTTTIEMIKIVKSHDNDSIDNAIFNVIGHDNVLKFLDSNISKMYNNMNANILETTINDYRKNTDNIQSLFALKHRSSIPDKMKDFASTQKFDDEKQFLENFIAEHKLLKTKLNNPKDLEKSFLGKNTGVKTTNLPMEEVIKNLQNGKLEKIINENI